ncbi:MAG TPA: hypothetical protein VGQ64_03910, partial [Candidatus Limnocylindrales bacterium]|nr:hypothetical protein [Candidatus Limnocylindrales bacterium]
MSLQARIAAAAVIGVLALGGAMIYLGRAGQASVGGPSPSPTAAATTSPSAAATLDIAKGYPDIPGWIVFEHFGQAPDGSTTEMNVDNRMIWLVKADGTGLHELAPGKPAEGKISPDISPDGQTVVFSSYDPIGLIWSVPITGGDPIMLTTNCTGRGGECYESDPAYSPDGKRIAFVQDAWGSEQSSRIGIQDLAAKTVTFIDSTRVPLAQASLHQPTWSPDGSQIAYHLDTQGPTDDRPTKIRIEVVKVDGTGLHELPVPTGEAKAGDPDWSP